MSATDSDTAMNDDNVFDMGAFGHAVPDVDDIVNMPEVNAPGSDETYDEPDEALAAEKPRSPKAKQYERKTRGLVQFAFHMTVRNAKTQPDAATLLMYGPELAKATGDLAAQNAWAARAVDMLTDTTDNAAAAFVMALTPMALQILRNHEPKVEAESKRALRIPFTQREIRLRWRFKLRRTRKFTYPPDAMVSHVFGNPKIFEALRKQGVNIESPRSS